jgi:hypothetical protein
VEKRSRTAVSSSSSRIEVLLAWIFLLDKALFFNLADNTQELCKIYNFLI